MTSPALPPFIDFTACLNKKRLCKDRSICSQRPLRKAIRFVREALRLRFAKPYHRNLTSAGYSASSVEKYHYHSDCHCRFSSKLNFRSGILARSPYINRKSHGVPTFGLFIRTNVLSACLFNFQGTVKGEIPCGEITPSLIWTKGVKMHTQNRPFSEKNLKKIFLTLKIALKTQKSRLLLRKETSGITVVLFRCIARSSFSFVLL